MRKLYIEEISDAAIPNSNQRHDIHIAAKSLYLHGDIKSLCHALQGGVFRAFSNRDYRWSNELVIKTAFLAALFNDRLYIMDSEPELERGYADLTMIVRPDMHHYGQLLDVLIEFKLIKIKKTKMIAKEILTASDKKLHALPCVKKLMVCIGIAANVKR
ncbi:MAG: PD-(D/E)XK nuclease domain-containing protein [Mariprofundales bacterium]